MILPLRWKPNRNILFIIPELSPIFPHSVLDCEDEDVLHPPLGVLYISSYCRKYGYNTYIIDHMSEKTHTVEFLSQFICDNQINCVGISCTMSASYLAALDLAKLCKKLGCITILGGVHVTATKEHAAAEKYIDIVCYGEGEDTWVDLLTKLNQGQSIVGTPGIAYQSNGNVIVEPQRKFIADLDLIPFPDYDRIDIERYIKLDSLGILTSRGCTNRCLFCTSYCTWKQQVRFRSPENIIAEIDWLVEKYGYANKTLLFYDDNFTSNKQRVLELCELMQKRNYNIKWKCMSRVTGIDTEMFEAMKNAGCFAVAFGFESGVEKSLRLMKKGISLADIEKAIAICKATGLEIYGYFIIGFPWETREDINSTVDFIAAHPEVNSALNFLTPYPGTTFHDDPDKWGITLDENWTRYTNLSIVMQTPNHSAQDLYDAYTRYLICMEER